MASPSLTSPRIEPVVPQPRRQAAMRDNRGAGFVWLSAAFAVCVLLLLLAVMWLSLTVGVPAIPGGPYSLANIKSMLVAEETWSVLGDTLIFASIATLLAMLGGTAVAWVVERTDFRAKQATYATMTVLLLLPGFFPSMGWLFLLGPRIGLIGRWLHDGLGLDQNAITIANPIGMGLVQGLLLVPLAFVLVGPPLRSISGELIEAAEIYGVGVWQRAWRIELPLVTPALIAAAIFCFMVAVASFDVPAFIGMTYRQYTFSTYVYQLLNPQAGLPRYGQAAALSLIAMLAAFVLTAIYLRAIRRGRLYQVVTGRGYRVAPLRLKRARGWIYAGLGVYFLLTFVLPMLLVFWVALSRYFRPPSLEAFRALSFANFANAPWALAWRGFENTAVLMVGVPLAAVLLGLIVSWVVVRSKSRLRGVIDTVLFLPHAVPAIVFAVALQTLALFVIGPFFQLAGTVWIIALVYLLTYLAFAVRAMSVAVVQVGAELEDAAYVAGLGVGGTLRAIFLPLVAPAALNAWLWIALLVFRELTMAVVLSTPANLTLPTVIWSTWYTGQVGQSTAMSLVFMLLFLPLALIYLFGRRGTSETRL